MTRDLRCFMVLVCLIAGCGDESEVAHPPDGPPLPGMTDTEKLTNPRSRSLDTAVSCLTRYDFDDPDPDAECRTELVDGDPLHWITTCPEHKALSLETEKQVSEGGEPLLERWQGIGASMITRYTYDDQGRLTLVESDNDSDGEVDRTKTITEHDEDGRPLAATIVGPVVYSAGDDFPAVEQQQTTGYDEDGRLVSDEIVLVVDGLVLHSASITYDEQTRRREWALTWDISPAFPDYPSPILVEGYELFDEENRPVTYNWLPDGSEIGWTYQYRYDEEGRLLTTIADIADDSDEDRLRYIAREVYDCP